MNKVGSDLKADHPKNSVAKDVSKDTTLPEFRSSIENQTVGGEGLALPPSSTDGQRAPFSDKASMVVAPFRKIRYGAVVKADDFHRGETSWTLILSTYEEYSQLFLR